MLLPYKTMEKGFPRKTKNKYLTAIIVEQIPRNISEELVLEWQFLGILSSPMEGRLNLQAKLEKERRSEYHFNDFLEVHSDSRAIFADPRSTFAVPRSTFAGPRATFTGPRATLPGPRSTFESSPLSCVNSISMFLTFLFVIQFIIKIRKRKV